MSECDWSSDVCSSDLTRLNSSHKQKTVYEISECDWSSDVFSSDQIGRASSELQSHSEISYAVFCLKKKSKTPQPQADTSLDNLRLRVHRRLNTRNHALR